MRYRKIRARADSVGKARILNTLNAFLARHRRVADCVRVVLEHMERVEKRSAVRELHKGSWVRLYELLEECRRIILVAVD